MQCSNETVASLYITAIHAQTIFNTLITSTISCVYEAIIINHKKTCTLKGHSCDPNARNVLYFTSTHIAVW